MPADCFVSQGDKATIGTFSALDAALVAQFSDSFVCAGGLVTIFAGSSAFKTAGIDIVTSAEKIAEESNLGCSRRILINIRL